MYSETADVIRKAVATTHQPSECAARPAGGQNSKWRISWKCVSAVIRRVSDKVHVGEVGMVQENGGTRGVGPAKTVGSEEKSERVLRMGQSVGNGTVGELNGEQRREQRVFGQRRQCRYYEGRSMV